MGVPLFQETTKCRIPTSQHPNINAVLSYLSSHSDSMIPPVLKRTMQCAGKLHQTRHLRSGIELSKPWLPEGINWCILAKTKKLLTTVLFFHNNHGSKDEKALYMYMASEGNKALKSITHLQRRRNFPGFHRGFLLPRCNRVFVVSFCVFGAPLGLV